MSDIIENKIIDNYKEHSQHTSQDWSRLKDTCSECYNICQQFNDKIYHKNDRGEHNHEVLNSKTFDSEINKNPIE